MVEAVTRNLLPVPSAPERPSDSSNSTQIVRAAAASSGTPKAPAEKKTAFDDQALDKIAARLVTPESRLAISQDSVIQRFIYKFVDKHNGDVIRQYPHERVVESLHSMEEARERFVDKRA